MLVLARRVGESILIAEDIKITVVSIDRGKIRLGITAPRDIPVNREEVALKIHQQGEQDASSSD